MHVQWGSISPTFFRYQSNGVKQGRILSPMIFNIYTNQLSIRLKRVKYSADIRSHLINLLYYADDLWCLISLTMLEYELY